MTARYRPVAYTSTVDESLFGSTSPKSPGNSRGSGFGSSPTKRSGGPMSLATAGASVVSIDDLYRIKTSAVIKSDKEVQAEREIADRERDILMKQSKDRKKKMKELEKKAVLMAKKSDIEIEEIAKKEQIRKLAGEKIDDSSDVVKLMTSMAQRAIAFTLREQQLEDKRRLEENEKVIEKRMDIMIEIDRLEDIKRREAAENVKIAKRLNDRKHINKQIDDRERTRMLQKELKEQENQAMRKLMESYKDEDEAQARKRAVMVEKSKAEVLKENDKAIKSKAMAKEREKRDMDEILMYRHEMDRKLAEREAEEANVAAAKKERELKLLAQQEKALDNAGREDELRARRAAEAKERKTREKEKLEALKRKADMDELMNARAHQAEDKKNRQRHETKLADEAILDNIQYMQRMKEREEREDAIKVAKTQEFKVKLQEQKEDVRRRRAMEEKPLGGGPNIREELIKEESKLNVIRERMISDLMAQGVDSRYLGELKNVNISKMLKR